MRAGVAALGLCALGAACGGDEGILVVVTEDDVAAKIDRLEFVVGVWEGDSFVASTDPPAPVTIGARDLLDDPYRLLLHDGERTGEPSTIVVAVIGFDGDQPAAFGAFEEPQPFLAGKVLQRQVVLNDAAECAAFTRGESGCIDYRRERIGTAEDPFCDQAQSSCECREGGPSALACYDGDEGTPGVGICRSGVRFCDGDLSSDCIGQVAPTTELCNGEDDDCDGEDDEDLPELTCGIGECAVSAGCDGGDGARCIPGSPGEELCGNDLDDDCDGSIDEECPCIRVAPNGDDIDGDGEVVPVQTIGRALELAVAQPDLPRVVCVASVDCDTSTTYTEPVTMVDGVHVQGGYEEAGFTRCLLPSIVTAIEPGVEGVTFDASVQSRTMLDGFKIFRPNGAVAATGVTIAGARGAVISNVEIPPVVATEEAIGVSIKDNARVTIQRSEIRAGTSEGSAIGVLAREGSTVDILHSCGFASGDDCSDDCAAGGGGIYAENAIPGDNTAIGQAVRLEDSTATITRSLICASDYGTTHGISMTGASNAVIEGNVIAAVGEIGAAAIETDGCAGAAPLILRNTSISAGSAGDAFGVHAAGNCNPVVQTNLITMRGVAGALVTGVACESDGNVGAGCTVIDNDLWIGTDGDLVSVGVTCRGGSCQRVGGNDIRIEGGETSIGLRLTDSGPLVDANRIAGACGASATGVRAEDASSRLENNAIYAATCEGGALAGTLATGLIVLVGDAGHEIDAHSNLIEASGAGNGCESTGIELGLLGDAIPAGPLGVYRNNIVSASSCAMSTALAETGPDVDPRKLHNNDLVPTDVLYRDEGVDLMSSIDDVNALGGAGENISADPDLADIVTDPHLSSDSVCIGAGTTDGAPDDDFEGDPRDDEPDIGPDERTP